MTEPTDAELLAEWVRVSRIADAGQRHPMRQIFEFAGSVPVRHLYPAASQPLRNAGVLRFAIKPIVLSDRSKTR